MFYRGSSQELKDSVEKIAIFNNPMLNVWNFFLENRRVSRKGKIKEIWNFLADPWKERDHSKNGASLQEKWRVNSNMNCEKKKKRSTILNGKKLQKNKKFIGKKWDWKIAQNKKKSNKNAKDENCAPKNNEKDGKLIENIDKDKFNGKTKSMMPRLKKDKGQNYLKSKKKWRAK